MSGAPRATRFAPSPTGRLHLGHALSAVRAFDLARAGGGRFLLRIEDIDGTRSRPEHVDAILRDLEWLGLEWDDLSFQSERLDLYAAAQARLADLLYPCFCTRAGIAASLSAPHGATPLYPGTCRHLSRETRAARMGEPHSWRLDMARAVERAGPLTWHDEYEGEVVADPLSHGDVILARKDAPASYHLAVSVDDAAQGVTDVVRGVDLFDATHVHRLLQALLDVPTPLYHHHPLIVGTDGQRLAKRHGAPALAAMREAGEDGRALADALRRNMLPAGFRLGEA
ncbi:tRNA glutamyl-Q(34) synthetase GluQRS [Sphingomonas sanguinis]|uniref:tRNA glutamyl-Q(34) synthetase GluQRS n=1 Tax=Sphingomonas sanguinis TaxID=33051 RepID=A0ABU5LMU4_9SPHN|nr:tRNA glutamyl-Q(34) synthetase GluQRS [Sphingomonas sanguinis]MDZ7281259.1 tRNA glutamyl-Q(34) synthetase GluQRS [Sphingomonas sanguinis]